MSNKIESIRVGEKTYTINDPNSATQEELEKLRDTTSKLEEDVNEINNTSVVSYSENSIFRLDITLVDTPAIIESTSKVPYHLGYQIDLIQAYKDGYRYVRFKGTGGPYSSFKLCGGMIIDKNGSIETSTKESTVLLSRWFTLPITENSSYLKASYQRLLTIDDTTYSKQANYGNGFEPEYVEFMKNKNLATNSLHQLFTSVGAIYNPTAEVKKRTLITFGENLDARMKFEFDHLPRHWYLNGVGDLTDEEMLSIYNAPHNGVAPCTYTWYDDCKTFLFKGNGDQLATSYIALFSHCKQLESIIHNSPIYSNNSIKLCFSDTSLKYLLPDTTFGQNRSLFYCYNGIDENCFYSAARVHPLEEMRLYKLRANANFKYCPNLSKTSLLFMINCSDATKAIVITLHPDAYDRLSEDSDVVKALETANNNLSSTGGSIGLATITENT